MAVLPNRQFMNARGQKLRNVSDPTEDLDGVNKRYLESELAWIKYTANSITLTSGTSASNISTLQTMSDGTFYTITEAAATPGINLIVDFVDVSGFENVRILAAYAGATTHAVACQTYNWTQNRWDTFNSVQMQASDVTTVDGYILCNEAFTVYDDTNYIGTGANAGKVRIRLYHTMSGNASHRLYIDEVSLRQ